MTTITHEQFRAAWMKFRNMDEVPMAAFEIVLGDLGITIAPPEPPERMVKLAREIVDGTINRSDIPGDVNIALAALQHADYEAAHPMQSYTDPVTGDVYIHQRTYRAKLGAAA